MTKIKIIDFDYELPAAQIAQEPANPRDHSRLLFFNSKKKQIIDDFFYNLADCLQPNDLLVINNSRVFPARLFGKKETGGRVEILLLEQNGDYWQAIVGGKVSIGTKIVFSKKLFGIIENKIDNQVAISFNIFDDSFWSEIEQIGQMPIPPYIKNTPLSERKLRDEYQTVYAKGFGSAAAPTAGLHFTDELIKKLVLRSMNFAAIDLHVGLGTFLPISDENVSTKKLHKEYFTIPAETIKKIQTCRKNGGRVIAVGTTSARALESVGEKIFTSKKTFSEYTDIFIQPGDKFQVIDGLITNFHLPKSSLMFLIAAFLQFKNSESGRDQILKIYNHAIENNYRFYSFGDAMLIL